MTTSPPRKWGTCSEAAKTNARAGLAVTMVKSSVESRSKKPPVADEILSSRDSKAPPRWCKLGPRTSTVASKTISGSCVRRNSRKEPRRDLETRRRRASSSKSLPKGSGRWLRPVECADRQTIVFATRAHRLSMSMGSSMNVACDRAVAAPMFNSQRTDHRRAPKNRRSAVWTSIRPERPHRRSIRSRS